jgi:hypothetical protein
MLRTQKTGQCNDPVKPDRPGGSTRDPAKTVFFLQMWDEKLFGLNTST